MLATLWGEPSVRRLALDGLSRDEVAQLATQVETLDSDVRWAADRSTAGRGADLARMDLAAVDLLHTRAGGNPFFLLQLMRSGAQPIPGTVRDVVRERARRLGPATVRVLQAAAVLGSEIDEPVLVDLVGRLGTNGAAGQVEHAVRAAYRARLLAQVPGRPGRSRFTHDLVREALYDDLEALARTRMHSGAGRAVRSVYADELNLHHIELLTHFGAAAALGDGVLAADHALAAAQQAIDRLAPDDALTFTALGLQYLPPGRQHDVVRLELLLVEADAHGTRMDLPAHRESTFRAIDVARRLDDPQALARTVDRNTVLPVMGTLDEQLLAVKLEAIAALDAVDRRPNPLRTRLLVSAAYQRAIGGHGWAAADVAQRAVADARALSDTDSVIGALYALASAAMGRPDLAEQLAVAEELVTRGRDRVDVVPERDGRRFRAMLRLAGGDRAGFEADLAGLSEFGDRTGSIWVRSLTAEWRVLGALLDGDLDGAEALANAVLGISGDDPNFLLGWFVQLVQVRLEQGRAAEMVDMAMATLGEHPELTVLRAVAANLHAASGNVEAARNLLAPLVQSRWQSISSDWLRPATLGYLAEPVRATQSAATCAELADLFTPYAGQLLIVGAGALVVAAADHSRAVLLAASGATALIEARSLLEDAIALAERTGSPTLAARSHAELDRLAD